MHLLPVRKRYVTKKGQRVWGHLTVSFFQDEHGTPLYLLGKIENITARKQAESALTESEARYRSIVNTLSEIGEGLLIIDENLSIQYMNQVMIDWFGDQTDQICYASVLGLEQPCSYCRLEQVIAKGDTVHYQPTTEDGRTFDVVATPILNSHGTFSKMEVIRDITAQKQAHQALIQSQQKYKNLVHSIDGVVWEADAKTFQFTFISQQAKRFFGYPLDDWLNQPNFWAEHLHPNDRVWAVRYCAQSTANKLDHDFEYRMITADQRTLWIRDLVTVIVENDQVVKLCGVMLDVTDKKRTEEKVAIFQRFIENSGEGMGMTTLDGKVVYMNPSLCRFVEEPNLKNVLGREFTHYYPEPQQKSFQAEVMPKLLQTGRWAGEMKMISSNGKITQTYQSFFLMNDNDNKPVYLAAVISNITDMKRTQQALKKRIGH
jgi:PAS domain S-box-containing protein